MSAPDLILHTETARVDVLRPTYPFQAQIILQEPAVTVTLSESEAELLARTIIEKPDKPEDDTVFLPKGKASPLLYEKLAKQTKKDLAEILRTYEMTAMLRARLLGLQIDLRNLAAGDVGE